MAAVKEFPLWSCECVLQPCVVAFAIAQIECSTVQRVTQGFVRTSRLEDKSVLSLYFLYRVDVAVITLMHSICL